MTPKELSKLLAKEAQVLAGRFLPNGQKQGGAWVCGSPDGEKGKSCKLTLNGEHAGHWYNFATGEKGDLIDLWRIKSGLSMADTMTEVKNYLGVREQEWPKQKTYAKPIKPKGLKKNTDRVTAWLNGRGITQKTIDAYCLAANVDNGKEYVVFPFKKGGETKMIKMRNIDDKKDMRLTSSNQEPVLFGWQAIPEKSRWVCLVEGEIDCLSMHEYGIPALSVPFGGGTGAKHQWLENEFNELERFDLVYLCLDMDEEGKAASRDLYERLGVDRCLVVELPYKDANECLLAGVNYSEMQIILDNAKSIDPEELKNAQVYSESVYEMFYPVAGKEECFLAPWPSWHGKFDFRFAELTILNGINGHGKSQGAGHILLGAMAQSEKVCIASMELKPQRLLERMTRQAAGLSDGKPTRDYFNAIFNWYGDNCWIFECVGTAKADRIIEVFTYARKRYGIRVFLIDSLLKCGFSEDDYKGQKLFAEKLCDFKNKYNAHVILVTHSKKKANEEEDINKFDVKGTGAITDLADNVINWMRNKSKERILEDQDAPIEKKQIAELTHDAKINIEKQRNGDWEKSFYMWFHQHSFQFLDYQTQPLHQYVKYTKERTV